MMPATTPTGAPGDHPSPAVVTYLRDLDRALINADPRERAEVIAGITEHIRQALPAGALEADVARVLADLGSVDDIAAGVSIDPIAAIESVPKWVLPTSYGLAVGSLIFVLLPFVSIPLAAAAVVISRRWWKQSRALHVRTAMVVCWVALGFSFLPVVLVLVSLLALVPVESGMTPGVPVTG